LGEGALRIVQLRAAVPVRVVGYLMVIPNRDPGELLVAGHQVKIGAVGGNSLAIVVEGVDLLVWERNAADGLTPAVVSVGIFIYVVSEMDNIINRVL
jgi:hypothetical protein